MTKSDSGRDLDRERAREMAVAGGMFAAVLASVAPLFARSWVALVFSEVLLLSVIVALLFHFRIWRMRHYVCPECAAPFKPALLSSLAPINMSYERKMRCPRCGCYLPMRPVKDR
ncbi:MAG: hypothetical protein FWH47_05030 [Methanomassiliicoccaceae archaeon]|nr:hypothetical protein [Methanomassiliicoccaceae archaeon]